MGSEDKRSEAMGTSDLGLGQFGAHSPLKVSPPPRPHLLL